MSADPWTDPDPKPGDFDADLIRLDPRYFEDRAGDREVRLIVLSGVEGEDARRLERISEARGKKAADVVAELLREADRSIASSPGLSPRSWKLDGRREGDTCPSVSARAGLALTCDALAN